MEQATTTPNFAHEIEFWEWFVKTDRFLNNWVYPEQNPEIRANHPDVAKCFDDFAAGWNEDHPIMILDVGSGALPWIKGILGTKGLVIPCDPLADEYQKIFDYDKFSEDAPIKAFAEDLPFDDNSFDIVHCSNALDHTQNPYKAILEMERVCRPGCMILIQGVENEATKQGWKGLHQWNIAVRKARPLDVQDSEMQDVMVVLGKDNQGFIHHAKSAKDVIYASTRNIAEGAHAERNWFVFAYKNAK